MKKLTIILIVIICLGTGFIGGVFYRNQGCESCQMYNTTFGVNGLCFEDYYCVWTKDRTPEEIASTEEHEKCHTLIDRDYYHFCEEYR